MKIGVLALFEALPEPLKELILPNSYEPLETIPNHSEPFQTIRNTLLNMNRNINIESEKESESYEELFYRVKIEYILPKGYEEQFLIWLKYKSEKGQSYKESGLKMFIKKSLKDYTQLQAFTEAIESSISKNYSGLFPDNDKNDPKNKLLKSAKSTPWKAND